MKISDDGCSQPTTIVSEPSLTITDLLRGFPPLTEWPANFEMRADGLYRIEDGKEGREPKTSRLTLVPFEIVARVTDERSEEPGTMIQWRDEADVLHEHIVLDQDLHGDAKTLATQLARKNLRVLAGAGSALGRFFSTLRCDRKATTYTRAGWHSDGNIFLLPNGKRFGSESETAILLGAKVSLFQTKGDLPSWQRHVASLAEGNSRLLMSLNLAFVGPLLEPTGEGFAGFHFVGASSTGKSTALYLGASVWGARARDQIRSWRTTDNGLEAWTSETSDTALFLDEMGQANPHDLANIVYMLGNGSGKGRMTRDGSAREVRQWRANVISTGETTIEAAQRSVRKDTPGGLDVRMINLPADAGRSMGMFEDIHGHDSPAAFADHVRTIAGEHYGVAGAAYLDFITHIRGNNAETFSEILTTVMADFTTRQMPVPPPGKKLSGQVARVVSKFALAAAAGELAIAGGVLPFEQGRARAAAAECLTAWLFMRGNVADREEGDVIAKIRAYISQYATSRFDDLHSSPTGIIDRAGWCEEIKDEDNGETVETHYLVTCDAFAKIVAPHGVSGALSALTTAGFLVGDKRRITTGGGLRGRVYTISDRILLGE